jgi:hypothetical protein
MEINMTGADDAGDDFVVGETNFSEKRSLLVAIDGDDGGYQDDFVLNVSVDNGAIPTANPTGIDAIQATGSVSFPRGGGINNPEGNGVVGRGLNGLVGYVHAAMRDPMFETKELAGVAGNGGPSGLGVRGTGGNGGMKGESESSVGVEGISQTAPGVAGRSPHGIGVLGESLEDGIGVMGSSATDNGGVFSSDKAAQLFLIPNKIGPLNSPSEITPLAIPVEDKGPPLPANAKGGQLMAVKDDQNVCTLWFCAQDGSPAKWAQVLLGREFGGHV